MKKFFRLHPLFLVLAAVLIIFGLFGTLLAYFLAVMLHEFAHAITAQKLGYQLNKIYILPFGAMLDINQNFYSQKDEILVAAAGPLCNIFLVIFCIGLWWIFPVLYSFTLNFVIANMVTCLINLLPCYPLDGGRIFVAAAGEKYGRKTALKICYIFNYIFSAIFIILFFVSFKIGVNFTFALMSIFIFFGTINNKFSGNYSVIKDKFKKNKDIADVKCTAVSSSLKLYQALRLISGNKFNIFYVTFPGGNVKMLTEKSIEKYLDKYSFDSTFDEILN